MLTKARLIYKLSLFKIGIRNYHNHSCQNGILKVRVLLRILDDVRLRQSSGTLKLNTW